MLRWSSFWVIKFALRSAITASLLVGQADSVIVTVKVYE
jgi:hypothetical protein